MIKWEVNVPNTLAAACMFLDGMQKGFGGGEVAPANSLFIARLVHSNALATSAGRRRCWQSISAEGMIFSCLFSKRFFSLLIFLYSFQGLSPGLPPSLCCPDRSP